MLNEGLDIGNLNFGDGSFDNYVSENKLMTKPSVR